MDRPGLEARLLGGREELRVSGSLSLMPPLLLLETAERHGLDCRLTLRDPGGGGVLIVLFRGGRPTMVFAPGDGRSLGELLLAAGVIDRALLSELLSIRAAERGSLERLLRERASLKVEDLQSYFDFQARARILEALTWRTGSFELERYLGDEESEFRLQLPSFEILALRAQARAATLAELLPRLPAPPEHLVVRGRPGGGPLTDSVQAAVLEALDEPLLVPQLVARLRFDDDLVLRAVVELEQLRRVVVKPRVAIVPEPSSIREVSTSSAGELLRAVLHRIRGADGLSDSALWVLVVGEQRGQARELVTRLGGLADEGTSGGDLPATTVARARVRIARDASLCAVAVEPESLSRGAMGPLLARFDVVCVVRGEAESHRLETLVEELAGGQLLVGVEVGRRGRPWPGAIRATLAVPNLASWSPSALAGLLIELMHGAASQA